MQDLNGKITGNSLLAVEWNEVPSELQNIIEAWGQNLSSGDLNQLGKGIAAYAAASTFYTGGGTANAHTATKIAGIQAPPDYFDGMIIRFRPTNANTAAATVNVDSLGIKSIVRENGDILGPNNIVTTNDCICRYDDGAGKFKLMNFATQSSSIGMCTGRLEWLSDTEMILKPAYGTIIYIEINGSIVSHVGNLTFDITADRFGDAEAPSTAYYLYVASNDGVLTPHIGAEEPHDIGDAKPGYNNTNPTYRCIGSCWNDSDSDLLKAQYDRDGWVRFNGIEATDHLYDESAELTVAGQADYRSLSLNLPLTASKALIHIFGNIADGTGTYMALAMSDAAVTTLDSGAEPWKLSDAGFEDAILLLQHGTSGFNPVQYSAHHVEMPIADRTAPALKYGHNIVKDPDILEFVVMGYQDIWAPKGY